MRGPGICGRDDPDTTEGSLKSANRFFAMRLKGAREESEGFFAVANLVRDEP